jgi:hypothetical protein
VLKGPVMSLVVDMERNESRLKPEVKLPLGEGASLWGDMAGRGNWVREQNLFNVPTEVGKVMNRRRD